MNWLAFVMAFQIGTSANFTSITPIEKDPSIYVSPNKAFYVTMEMGANIFDFISVNGFMKSYQVYCGDIYFAPYKIDYGFDSFIYFDNIKIGFKHQCDHPVISSNWSSTKISSTNTEIYLRYEINIK